MATCANACENMCESTHLAWEHTEWTERLLLQT